MLSKSAFVAVHLHFCYAILPPVFSPWPPTLLYWIPIFAASTLSCISEGTIMRDAEHSEQTAEATQHLVRIIGEKGNPKHLHIEDFC